MKRTEAEELYGKQVIATQLVDVKYLRTGEQENLVYDEYSTDKIIKAYWVENLDYIKAVVILDNIERFGDNGCYVFNPYIVE